MYASQVAYAEAQRREAALLRLDEHAQEIARVALLGSKPGAPSGDPCSFQGQSILIGVTARTLHDLGVEERVAPVVARLVFRSLLALETARLEGVAKDVERAVRNEATRAGRERIEAYGREADELLARRLGREARRRGDGAEAALLRFQVEHKALVLADLEPAFRAGWEIEEQRLDDERNRNP